MQPRKSLDYNSMQNGSSFDRSYDQNKIKIPNNNEDNNSYSKFFLDNKFLATADKPDDDVLVISKQDLEIELKSLVATMAQDKALTEFQSNSLFEYMKKAFFDLMKENTKLNYILKNSPETTERKLRSYIFELENDRVIYDEKIKKHTMYIFDLEQKVNTLIEDYERIIKENEKLNETLQMSNSYITPQRGKGGLKNSEYDNNNILNSTHIIGYQKDIEEINLLKEENIRLKKKFENLDLVITTNQSTIANLNSSLEILIKDNESYKSKIIELETIIKNNKTSFEDSKITIENLYQSKQNQSVEIENLRNKLIEYQNKIYLMEAELKNKAYNTNHGINDMGAMANLEQKINDLMIKNAELQQKLQENMNFHSKDINSQALIPNQYAYQLDEIHKLRLTFEAMIQSKDIEIQNERQNQKNIIEKYNIEIQKHQAHIKALVTLNDNLIKNVEGYKNQKYMLKSIITEIKKKIDEYKSLTISNENKYIYDNVYLNSMIDIKKLADNLRSINNSLDKVENLLEEK